MAGTTTLKYGTIVLVGMATITAWFYDVPWDKRSQIYMSDYVEVAEAVREREMIVTAISGTNQFFLQIATNRTQMLALDNKIISIIPYFVDQSQIDAWAASGATGAPPHWTVANIFSYSGVLYTNGGFLDYEIHTTKTDLERRYLILKNMIYTDDQTTWSTNNNYYYNSGSIFSNYNIGTNIYAYGDYSYITMTNDYEASKWWTNNMIPLRPTWWVNELNDVVTMDSTDPSLNYIGTSYGNAPYWYWYAHIDIISWWLYERAVNGYGGVWRDWVKTWSITKYYGKYGNSRKMTAQMRCTTRSVPITRTDYYFTNLGGFETISVSSNTTYSNTSGFVEPFDQLWGGISTNVHVNTTNMTFWQGYPWAKDLDGSSTNLSFGVSGYDTKTNGNPWYCIHKWNVERCY